MRITDLIGYISYGGIIINLLVISFHLNRSFGVQIRHRILLWIVVLTSASAFTLCGAIMLFFYNRIHYVSNGLPTPQWVSDTSVYFWLSFFLSLSGISFLLLTRRTKSYINLERKNRDANN